MLDFMPLGSTVTTILDLVGAWKTLVKWLCGCECLKSSAGTFQQIGSVAITVVSFSALFGLGTLLDEVLVFSLAIGANISDVNVTDPSCLTFLDFDCQGGQSHHVMPCWPSVGSG